MAYGTKADMINERLNADKLAELSQHIPQELDEETGDYPTLDTRVDAALRDASSLIDTYLSQVVSLPVTDEQALLLLKHLCLSITEHYLFLRYGMPDDDTKAAYSEAVGILKALASGAMQLPGAASEAASRADWSANDRVFTLDDMEDW